MISKTPHTPTPATAAQGRPRFGLPLLLAVLLLAGLCTLGPAAPPVKAQGDVTLRNLGGGSVSEGELSRGPTVVVVWASWSPRGRDIVERVRAIEGNWGSRSRVVTVNFQEDAQAVRDFLGGQSMGVPVYLDVDGVFAKKHAVTSLPGLLVFQGGRVAYRGSLPEDPSSVLSEILQ